MAKMGISTLLGTFLLTIVGLALSSTIVSLTTTAAAALTGASAALINLIPLFWVLLMIAIDVAAVYSYMKGSD